jgi:hypothetical protein
MVIVFHFNVDDILFRLIVGLLIIELLVFALGLVIDRLSEGFELWAFGAIITYVGTIVLFSPLWIWIITNVVDPTVSVILIIAGVLIMFLGYFTEAYDLNERIAKALMDLLRAIRSYNYREGARALFRLIKQVFWGFLAYLKRVRNTLANFFRRTGSFIKRLLKEVWSFLRAIPSTIYHFIMKTARWIISNIHGIGVFAGTIVFIVSLLGPLDPFTGIIILLFSVTFFLIKAAYPRKEQLIRIAVTVRDRVWETSYQINYRVRTIAENRRRINCPSCQREIPLGARECDFCEKEIKRCMICKLPIKDEQEPSECPFCKNPAHEDHWKFWIDLRHECPACKQKIPSITSS